MSGKWTPGSAEPIGYIAEDVPTFFAKYGAAKVSTGMTTRPNPRENTPVYLRPTNAITSELAEALEALLSDARELLVEAARRPDREALTADELEERGIAPDSFAKARAALAKAMGEGA
ncbi:hypothetical protein [Asaia astilbis]